MPETTDLAERKLREAAQVCVEAANRAAHASVAFRNLKAAIEREGYFVMHHLHNGQYSLLKLDKVPSDV